MADSEIYIAGKVLDIAKRKLDLDTILVEEIGQFGRFQLRSLLLAFVVVVFASWAGNEYLFTTARIRYRCHIPECDSEEPEFLPVWLQHAVPDSTSSQHACQRYGNASVSSLTPAPGACPADLFNTSVLTPCEAFVYENTNTVVYDYDLACDEWRRTFIGTIRKIGSFANPLIVGYISDRWGRRTVLVIVVLNTAWIGITRYWADTYIKFLISEAAEAMFGSGSFNSCFILLTEITGPKYRLAVGATLNSAFSVGQIIIGLIAWAVPNWRSLTLILYIPQFLTIAYIWLMTESVRWYMSKGRYDESEALLQKIARTNGKQLSPESLAALRQTATDVKQNKKKREKTTEPWLIVQVFRHKSMLVRCLVAPVWWITSTFINYGMTVNSVNMSGNRYINYIAVSIVEIPGYWTAVLLMGKLGRKPVLMGSFLVCALCQFIYIFLPSDMYAASLIIYMIGKYSIAIEVATVYIYTAELYPTKYRHSLFGFSYMIGKIGGIAAPLTPAFGASTFEAFPSVLFGSFALLSGFLVLLTPETLGTKLSDTMADAEDLGKNT